MVSLIKWWAMTTLTLFFVINSQAQSTKETLTNTSIINLHKAGLGSSVIISKIKSSSCNFDLTTEKLILLKKSGLSDEVVTAMLEKSAEATPKVGATDQVKTKPAPTGVKTLKPGIHYQDSSKFVELEPAAFSQTKQESGILTSLTYGIAKSRQRSTLSKPKANLQITGTSPTFYFVFDKTEKSKFGEQTNWYSNATSPNEFVLVKLKLSSSKKSREIVTGSYNTWDGFSSGIEDDEKVNFKYEKLSDGLYKIIFEEELLPGEYCFIYASSAAVHGAAPLYKVFDFGITKK